jgi:RNA polymerase sigma-70 factor (ECF subfamily)
LLTILHNVFLNRYRVRRREQRKIEYDDTLLDDQRAAVWSDRPSNDPQEMVLSQLLDDEIENALRDLPGDFLSAVLLVDLQELTYEEAAEALSCPVGTVRSRLSRGRRLLHEKLKQYAQERGLLVDGR